MADSSECKEMTEVALALAMAFFSIMVLTMVSMGSNPSPVSNTAVAPSTLQALETAYDGTQVIKDTNTVIIVWKNRFLNKNLRPIKTNELDPKSKIVLAISPELKMVELMRLRSKFKAYKTSFSPLDSAWLERLNLYDEKRI